MVSNPETKKRLIVCFNERLGDRIALKYFAENLRNIGHVLDSYEIFNYPSVSDFRMEDWAPGLFENHYYHGQQIAGNPINHKNLASLLQKDFPGIERGFPAPGNLFVYTPRMISITGRYPTLKVPEKHEQWLNDKLGPFPNKPVICFHILTDAPYSRSRNHHFKEWDKCITELAKEDVEIYRVGIPQHRLTCQEPNVHDLSHSGLTPSQSIAVISLCDVYVGGDTGMTHAASALGKKIVGVWGDITHMLRNKVPRNNIQPGDWHSGPYVPEDKQIVFRRDGGPNDPKPIIPAEKILGAIKEMLNGV